MRTVQWTSQSIFGATSNSQTSCTLCPVNCDCMRSVWFLTETFTLLLTFLRLFICRGSSRCAAVGPVSHCLVCVWPLGVFGWMLRNVLPVAINQCYFYVAQTHTVLNFRLDGTKLFYSVGLWTKLSWYCVMTLLMRCVDPPGDLRALSWSARA